MNIPMNELHSSSEHVQFWQTWHKKCAKHKFNKILKWKELWKKQGYGTSLYIGLMLNRLKVTWKIYIYLYIVKDLV
jgi:hypothetical protein